MTSKKTQHNPSYQELSNQLDELLAKLQHPDCDVDDAVKYYEAALQCIKQLEDHLTTAGNRITKIQANFTDTASET